MSPGSRGRSGRRAGDQGTRETILAAARGRFGDHGFDGATIRGIAADAEVDPALVMHYFGNKVDLFGAAMQLPITPTEALAVFEDADPEQLGELIMRLLFAIWEDAEAAAVWFGLIRSAMGDEKAAQMLQEFLTSTILQRIAGTLDAADAAYRVSLVASQIMGLGVARYIIRIQPLASASPEELVEALAPTLQRYLTGDLS